MNTKLTVFFEDPFWVGVFEKVDSSMLQTSKVVFGAEPRDYEVYDFVLKNYDRLDFSRPLKAEEEEERKINPKRMQRQIQRETADTGVGTRAQQAMKMEHELRKTEREKTSREMRLEREEQKFLLRQEKKKEKKKGH